MKRGKEVVRQLHEGGFNTLRWNTVPWKQSAERQTAHTARRSDGKYHASGVLLAVCVFLSAQASPAPGLHEETMECWGKRQRPNWQPQCGQNMERHAERSVSREGLAQGPGTRAQDTLLGSKQSDAISGAHWPGACLYFSNLNYSNCQLEWNALLIPLSNKIVGN